MAGCARALATTVCVDARNEIIDSGVHQRLTVRCVNLVLVATELDESDLGHSRTRNTKLNVKVTSAGTTSPQGCPAGGRRLDITLGGLGYAGVLMSYDHSDPELD